MMAETNPMSNPLKVLSNDKPWYSEGLRFKCTECGQCCTGAPGYAWVTDEEIQTIADHLKMSVKDFGKRFLRIAKGRYALVEKKNYDCIFLKDKKCSIYPVRPTQCRTFPWWMQNLSSPEEWKEAAKYCEGISDDAPLVSYEMIESQLALDKKNA
jgi:Fe-S-cluster containining protein